MEDPDYTIPCDRFESGDYIAQRTSAVPLAARGSVKTALSYLYLISGPVNLPRERLKTAEPFMEPRERVLLRWLYTRTNGNLRSTYGAKALLAARKSHFRCCMCGYADVRALHIDHVDGRTAETACSCLCANCHNIKSRASDWSGERRYS
jgi:hypothetical protein